MRLLIFSVFFLLFISCKNTSTYRKDLSELNESLGYQTAVDVNTEKDTKKAYPDPSVFDYFALDIDGDSKKDSIFLKVKSKNNEPGVFHEIHLVFSSGTRFRHGNPIAFDKYDTIFKGLGKNELKSEYLHLLNYNGQKYIFMSCYKAECCSRNQTVIKINGNRPVLLFNKGFDISYAGDSDQDGILELIGKSTIPQIFESLPDQNAEIGTYVPYEVYLLTEKAEYSLERSKQYNEQHYIWAGPKPSPFVKVLYPNDFGKPTLYQE